MKERIESPSRENSPVSISKIKNPDAVINASEINNALPMSKLEYFFRIIAMISGSAAGRTDVKKNRRSKRRKSYGKT